MTTRTFSIGFAAGLVVGVVLAVALSAGSALPRATAQAQGPASANSYSVSAWSHPGASGVGGPQHGAYVVDTRSGKVWSVQSSNG